MVRTSQWRKSSYSGGAGGGGTCVEMRRTWFKSTHSGSGDQCIELCGDVPGEVATRDSKDPNGPVLSFAPSTFRAFTESIKANA